MSYADPSTYDPTPAIRGVHRSLPIPQPPEWAGYWTFVTASIILMFLLYVAGKGTLNIWLGFFAWNPQPAATAGNATAASAVSALTAGLPTSVSQFLTLPSLSTSNLPSATVAPTPGVTATGTPTGGS